MSRFLLVGSLLAAFFAGSSFGGTISYSVSPLSTGVSVSGQSLYRLTYSVQGQPFLANYELDIQFDPSLYVSLTNGVAPAGFDLLLEQPNNPPGTAGDFSALSLTNNPSVSGVFSVDVLSVGRPNPQNYVINQLDANGFTINHEITAGVTINADVPEPSSGIALLIGSVILAVRWRLSRA